MARDTLYAIGEALIDMIPSGSGCAFADVLTFAPRMGLEDFARQEYFCMERAFFAKCHFLTR